MDTFTPPTREDGDRVPAKEMVGRPLIVQVREHRTGIKTQFNSNPADAAKYKPEGGEAVMVDLVDLSTRSVYIGVLWFNGAIVDSLKSYVAHTLPVKLFYDTPKTGNNPYLNVEALTGQELALAQQWAAANPNAFDQERAARAAQQQAAGIPPIPGAPSTPPSWVPPVTTPPVTTTPVAAPFTPPATPPTPPGPGGVDVNDPAIQALLAQLAAQQPRS